MTKEDAVNGMLRDTADALDSMRTTTAVGHTPGPWTVHQFDGGDEGQSVMPVNGEQAVAGPFYGTEAQTNARLIAAAPEMLEALRDAALDLTDYTDEPRIAEIVTAMRAAIAKATNE
jgi:hypothetical protein